MSLASIAGVAVLVFQGVDGNNKCSWCHYLSCVPTSKWDCHNSIACDVSASTSFLTITCVPLLRTVLILVFDAYALLFVVPLLLL